MGKKNSSRAGRSHYAPGDSSNSSSNTTPSSSPPLSHLILFISTLTALYSYFWYSSLFPPPPQPEVTPAYTLSRSPFSPSWDGPYPPLSHSNEQIQSKYINTILPTNPTHRDQFTTIMQKNLAKGTTPSARDLVSFGNTLMRAVEAHMQSHQPRLTPQQPGKVTKLEVIKEGVGTRRQVSTGSLVFVRLCASLCVFVLSSHAFPAQISSHAHTYTHLDAYKHAAMSAKYYYELAISQNGHFGAHYSLGLMLKLHMFLLTGVTGGYRYEEEGGKQASIDGTEDSLATFAYAHLCQSQVRTVRSEPRGVRSEPLIGLSEPLIGRSKQGAPS